VIAAFLIFSVGYLALFLCIMICLVIARFILEGAKVVRAQLVRPASANSCVSSEVETLDFREKGFAIPTSPGLCTMASQRVYITVSTGGQCGATVVEPAW
jgi:hypothetical protein